MSRITTVDRYTIEVACSAVSGSAEIMPPYSGRGMFGKTCLAIDLGDMTDALEFISDLTAEDPEVGRYLASHARFDSLGMGYVIYWPGIEPLPTDEEEED